MNIFQHEFKDQPVTLDIQRSNFIMPYDHKTTFNQGGLYPFFLMQTIPGDTIKMDMSAFVRMTTPIYPVMDNAVIDVHFWYVPWRLLWDHTKEFFGENTSAPWAQTTEYIIPKANLSGKQVTHSDLIHYLGLPIKTEYTDVKVNALPLRAYYLIWSEFYRDQNTQYPINIYKGDSDVSVGSDLTGGFKYGKDVLPVTRLPDYFSTALPQPQKGDAVRLPLGLRAPVETSTSYVGSMVGGDPVTPLRLHSASGNYTMPVDATNLTFQRSSSITTQANLGYKGSGSGNNNDTLVPSNLFANLEYATAATVNQLRQAFAFQRMLERDALSGSRYREQIKSHFSVQIPDSTVQVPEYLGGFRQPINVDQVVQTSSTDSTSPLATTSGVSVTTHKADDVFTKSFTEVGYIIGLYCVRVEHTYSQGIEPLWMYDRRYDVYDPLFANLGNQPIYRYELFAGNDVIANKDVFGYKECWAEYRYLKSRNAGLFAAAANSTGYEAPLGSWIYGDQYSEVPLLSDGWMREGSSNVQNTLAVQDEDQFLGDFFCKVDAYRPMPLYSIPGLIDHH